MKNTSKLDQICAHFKESGWLILSNFTNRKYKSRVANQISFSRIIGDMKRFVVESELQPFGYNVPQEKLSKTDSFTLVNASTVESETIITIFGGGNITLAINNKNVILTGISGHTTLDSEMQNAYSDTLLQNNKMQGEFPTLSLGGNYFSWIGNVTKPEIEPNWRWL